MRRDTVDKVGRVTLGRRTKLHHTGMGRAHVGERVIMSVHDLDVRAVSDDEVLLRHLTLDPDGTTIRWGPGDVYDA